MIRDFKRVFKKLYYVPSNTLNTSARIQMGRLNALMKNFSNPILINVGCGDRFIGGDNLERYRYEKIINLDVVPQPSVDVFSDVHALPFRESSISGVVCQAVLEHVKDPKKAVSEIYKVLQKGGIVYVEVPFLQGYHPSPHDFFRFTPEGLDCLFSRFVCIDAGVCVGPSSALSWILKEYLSGLLSGFSQNKTLQRITGFISAWLTCPIKYLDFFLSNRPGAYKIASGFYYMGRKD